MTSLKSIRPVRLLRFVLATIVVTLHCSPGVARAQETIERTLNVSGGWVGYPGMLYVNVPFRFGKSLGPRSDVEAYPTFDASLALPWHTLVGGRFAPMSATVPGRPNEWEAYARIRPVGQAHGMPLDAALTVAFNGAAESLDGEVSLARWLGRPVRLLGVVRVMGNPFGMDDADVAVGGGAVIHPLPGRLPIAAFGDVGMRLDREDGERLAWSAGLQIGLAFTDYTVSLFATNTPSSTLQGGTRGTNRERFGIEITLPIPAGRFVGAHVPREEAMEAVIPMPDQVERLVLAEARNYLFLAKRIEIEAGTTIQWTNRDGVVHTVTADDGTWNSGAIQPGESWRARFDRPGKYPYHCGPHPYMKGIVIVR